MYRTLIIGLVIATMFVPSADAMFDSHPHMAERLAYRITDYRQRHHRQSVKPALNAHAASIALAKANHEEGVFNTKIAGVPFWIWNDPLLGDKPATILASRRCKGKPYTPAMVMDVWKGKSGYKSSLLDSRWNAIGVFAVDIKGKGAWSGRGICRAYYVTLVSQ